MSLDILKKRIADKNIGGLYLFFGDEEYTKDHYASMLKKLIKNPDFNYFFVDTQSIDISVLDDTLETPPSMSDYKLIVIRDPNVDKNKANAEELMRVLSYIPEDTCVLLLFRKDKITVPAKIGVSKSSEFFSFAFENGLCVEFPLESHDKLISWAVRHLKSQKAEFHPDVPSFLIGYCGGNMYNIHGELQKLAAFYSGIPLSVDDVKNVCIPDESYKIYELCDNLMNRNLNKCEVLLDKLVDDKTPPVIILSLLSSNFNDIFHVKSAFSTGKSRDELKKLVKAPDWKLRNLSSMVSKINDNFLTYAINEILKVNKELVSTSVPPYELIRLLIYKIAYYDKK